MKTPTVVTLSLTLVAIPAVASSAERALVDDGSPPQNPPAGSAAGIDSPPASTQQRDPEPRPESGFEHSLRSGLSFPAGQSSDGRALNSDVVRRVPVMVDIGYRANRVLYLALMGMVGIDVAQDDCGLAGGVDGASCTVEGWRVGFEFMVHPLPRDSLDLWLGAAVGWERLEQKVILPPPPDQMGGFSTGTTLRTGEEGPALDLQAGIDFPVEGKLGVGPFAGYTLGSFIRRTSDCPPDAACPEDIDETGIHHWLTLGIRGKFGP